MLSPTLRLTLASFLAYCVMSGMLSPIGIVLPPLAEHLQQPVEAVAPLFSWLTVGILVGSALSLVVFQRLSLRAAAVLVYAAIALSLLGLRFGEAPWLLRLALGTVGVGCGIGLAAAASTIALLYDDRRRASMLVITDGAFSIAGIVTSALAVHLVAGGMHWAAIYLLVAAAAGVIVVLALATRYPAVESGNGSERGSGHSTRWPLAVWLCISALFLYTLGQYCVLWWLPSHLETALSVPRGEAGVVVSRYWSGMLVGQLLVAWWVLRLGARRMVLLSVAGTFLGSLPLWSVGDMRWLPALALTWGVINFGLLKVVIGFASSCVPRPTPRLMAALLFGATSGTALSPLVTSGIVAIGGTLRVLQFGSVCYLVLAVLILVARRSAQPDPVMVKGVGM